MRRWADVFFNEGVLLRRFNFLNWLGYFYRRDLFRNVEGLHLRFIFENLNSSWFLSNGNFEEITKLFYCYLLVGLKITVNMLDNCSTNFSTRKLFNIRS